MCLFADMCPVFSTLLVRGADICMHSRMGLLLGQLAVRVFALHLPSRVPTSPFRVSGGAVRVLGR